MFERDLWSGEYSRKAFPRFTCPRSIKGRLVHDQQSLFIAQPQHSRSDSDDPNWEPAWDTYRFGLRLTCDNSACGEIALVSGDTTVAEYYDEDLNNWALVSLLRPQALFAAPPIIAVPKEVPDSVSREVEKAFQLFWVDLSASANRLRVSVGFRGRASTRRGSRSDWI